VVLKEVSKMTQQTINVGTVPNDQTGDQARTAFQKVNANFTDLYSGNFSSATFSLPLLDTYANEAAALAAGLPSGRVYKTATGELRIKL
jgi:hypothetical protein